MVFTLRRGDQCVFASNFQASGAYVYHLILLSLTGATRSSFANCSTVSPFPPSPFANVYYAELLLSERMRYDKSR